MSFVNVLVNIYTYIINVWMYMILASIGVKTLLLAIYSIKAVVACVWRGGSGTALLVRFLVREYLCLTKRGVTFRQYTRARAFDRKWETKCLNIRFSVLPAKWEKGQSAVFISISRIHRSYNWLVSYNTYLIE